VDFSEGKRVADSYAIPFFETSAKENLNISESFAEIAKNIKEKISQQEQNTPGPMSDGRHGRRLRTGGTNDHKKKGCC